MGLFDKRKRSDDFDSPVENIDLSAAAGASSAAAHDDDDSLRAAATPAPQRPRANPPQAEPDPEPDRDPPAYGIDDAILLMRALPADNVELVVQVVKRTLESTQVKVKSIIDDASRKQSDIEGRISVLKKEIDEYEQEIATRRQEIEALETDHAETTTVKERLILAEKLTGGGKPAPAASAPAAPRPTVPPPNPGGGSSASSQERPIAAQAAATKGTTIVAKK